MSDTTITSLSRESVRLECLRLAHRPDKDALTVITRAEEYEMYVLGAYFVPAEEDPPPPKTDKPTAKARSKSS